MELIPGRVMVFGTYDVFHLGHRFFIETAMGKGGNGSKGRKGRKDRKGSKGNKGQPLVIVIARDVTVKKIKPLLRNPEKARMRVVQEAFPELTVVLGDKVDPMKVIRKYRPSLVCLGYDQIGFSEELQKNFPEIVIERIGAFEPERYKSSKMA